MGGISKLSTITCNRKRIEATPIVSPFRTLLATKIPWGYYRGASCAGNVLPDESGNGRHATMVGVTVVISTGFSALVPLSVCKGLYTSSIVFPDGSIPINYTVCGLTRYSGSNSYRILSTSNADNILFGHYAGASAHGVGAVYDGGEFKSPILYQVSATAQNVANWVGCCVVNNTPSPANILINGLQDGEKSIAPNAVASKMGVNAHTIYTNETSNFEFSHLYIWDVNLTTTELKVVADAFNSYLANGVL